MKIQSVYPLILILFSLASFWPGQATIPPIDRDECRFAEASRQMAASGDLVDIRFQDQPRYQKPVGIYWLQALAVKALGEDPQNPIWPYRLPSLLGGVGAVLATYALGRNLLDRQTGLIAALLLAACALLNIEARLATVESMLLFTTTAALACLARCYPFPMGEGGQPIEADRVRAADFAGKPSPADPADRRPLPSGRGYALLFWLALTAGILLKGPVILMVVGFALLLSGQPKAMFTALKPAVGLPLLLAMIAPWLVLISLRSHGAFWQVSLGHDLGAKLVAGQESHGAWPGTYLVELPFAFWPASPFVLAALPYAWVNRRRAHTRFLLAVIVPCWLVFETVPTKLPHYVLPLFPPLAVLTAAALRDGASRFWVRARHYRRFWLPGMLGLALASYAIGFGMVMPRLTTPFVMREFVRHRAAYPATLQTGAVALAGFHEPSAVLWLGPETQLVSGPEAARLLAAGAVQLALVTPAEAATFATAAFTAIETLDGYDYANGYDIHLTVYRRPE